MGTEAIAIFPAWKSKNTSAAERLSELEALALKYPERFQRLAVIYIEILPDGKEATRQISFNCTTNELIGILEQGKIQVLKDTGGL